MSKHNQPRIAVIGCGYWGKNIVRNMAELGVLVAISDPNLDQAAKMSATYNVPAKSLDEIFADSEIEAVAIAAPAVLHHDLAEAAIRAGKDVFVEKPLGLDVVKATALCDLADKNGRILMVGHLLRYHSAFQALEQLVQKNDLGTIRQIYSNRLSLGKIRNEENVLWSFAPHDISMVLGLLNKTPTVVGVTSGAYLQNNIADCVTVTLQFDDNVNAQIMASWLHPEKDQRLIVIGDRAMAVFNDLAPWDRKLMIYRHKIDQTGAVPVAVKDEGQAVAIPESEPLRAECQHFIDCIKNRSTPRTDGREGVRVLHVLERAEQAMSRTKGKTMPTYQDVTIHESAYVDDPVTIGAGTKIWHFSHVLPRTNIGEKCVIGQNCVIGPDVNIGHQCKIQNNVSVYKGVTLEDGVFCGPSCVFTNVNNPRAEINRQDEFRTTMVRRGATIGANATIVCGYTLGAYCFIAAGAVVTGNVPDYALMAGVPAKRIGWMSRAGAKLDAGLVCPIDGIQYIEQNGLLVECTMSKEAVNG